MAWLRTPIRPSNGVGSVGEVDSGRRAVDLGGGLGRHWSADRFLDSVLLRAAFCVNTERELEGLLQVHMDSTMCFGFRPTSVTAFFEKVKKRPCDASKWFG